TLNPQPSTLNPQPSTLNPQPSTLNPQPQTLNPHPYNREAPQGKGRVVVGVVLGERRFSLPEPEVLRNTRVLRSSSPAVRFS
ncbi:hypothetical protein T484DRAFT_1633333, partial [Baffinella frigidus]